MSRTRDPILIGVALAVVCTATVCTLNASRWIDREYPGFLMLDNGLVAAVGLAHWPALEAGAIYHAEVVAMDGVPVGAPRGASRTVFDAVARRPAGTKFTYRFLRDDTYFERTISSRTFTAYDFALLFGAYLVCGVALCGVALSIRYLRGRDAVAYGTFFPMSIAGIWSLTAMDLFGPAALFRIHALCEALLFAAAAQLALTFPTPLRWLDERPRWHVIPYALALPVIALVQYGLYEPDLYAATHTATMSLFAASLVFLVASQIARFIDEPSFESRQQIKIVALGAGLALAPQLILAIVSEATGTRSAHNWMALTGILFPLSVAYAALRHNLMGVDSLVRGSLHYAVFSVAVAAVYAASLAAFGAVFHGSESYYRSGGFALFFGLFSAIVLLPMRDALQRLVNRSFFRTPYDYALTIEETSRRLASATEVRIVVDELSSSVAAVLHSDWVALYLRRKSGGDLQAVDPAPLPSDVVSRLLSAVEDATAPFEDEQGNLAVPFRTDARIRAVLMLGRKRSGRIYTGNDRRLLQTMANQGVVALQNALVMDELRDVNHELEWRVTNRTRELNFALGELREKNQLLTHLSTTDAVTTLRNRAYLDDALDKEFERARRYGSRLSILMADVDHFKRVNDEHGHQVGDAVLRRVGEIVRDNLRSSDVAGRYGGEEFLVILTESDGGPGALVLAERIRGSVESEEFTGFAGRRFRLTLSIGAVTLQERHESSEALLGDADAALYQAKSGGRNRVETGGPR